jgi:uncharacterized membrane protein
MPASDVFVLAFLIGFFTGLRSLTPIAVTAWGAHLGLLTLPHALAWLGTIPGAVVFSLGAIAELIADKLPTTPARTAPLGLAARMVMGGLAGACIASAGGQGMVAGAMVAIAGALAGTFGGYQARMRLTKALQPLGFGVALLEDFVAIGGALLVVTRF